MDTDKATTRPWRVWNPNKCDNSCSIAGPNGERIASLVDLAAGRDGHGHDPEGAAATLAANAALIVQAVNAHDVLVDALESLLFACRDGIVLPRDCAHQQARAALTLARE